MTMNEGTLETFLLFKDIWLEKKIHRFEHASSLLTENPPVPYE